MVSLAWFLSFRPLFGCYVYKGMQCWSLLLYVQQTGRMVHACLRFILQFSCKFHQTLIDQVSHATKVHLKYLVSTNSVICGRFRCQVFARNFSANAGVWQWEQIDLQDAKSACFFFLLLSVNCVHFLNQGSIFCAGLNASIRSMRFAALYNAMRSKG